MQCPFMATCQVSASLLAHFSHLPICTSLLVGWYSWSQASEKKGNQDIMVDSSSGGKRCVYGVVPVDACAWDGNRMVWIWIIMGETIMR